MINKVSGTFCSRHTVNYSKEKALLIFNLIKLHCLKKKKLFAFLLEYENKIPKPVKIIT